jgi:hypothetical protein
VETKCYLSHSSGDTRWNLWIPQQFWQGHQGTVSRMCYHQTVNPQRIHWYQDNEGEPPYALATGKGGDFIFLFRIALQLPQGWISLELHWPLPHPQGNPSAPSRTGTGLLGSRAIGYAPKNVWMLSHYKTTIHPTQIGRLQ